MYRAVVSSQGAPISWPRHADGWFVVWFMLEKSSERAGSWSFTAGRNLGPFRQCVIGVSSVPSASERNGPRGWMRDSFYHELALLPLLQAANLPTQTSLLSGLFAHVVRPETLQLGSSILYAGHLCRSQRPDSFASPRTRPHCELQHSSKPLPLARPSSDSWGTCHPKADFTSSSPIETLVATTCARRSPPLSTPVASP